MNFDTPGSKEDTLTCNAGNVIVTMFAPMDAPWLRLALGDPLTVKCQGKYLLTIGERSLLV